MNTKEYIASGILENYLLNNCSPQEQQEVACLSKIYPEIKQELNSLEIALEKLALTQAKTPPAAVWDNILNEIEEDNNETSEVPKPVLTVVKDEKEASTTTAKTSLGLKIWRVAASVALLASAGLIFSFYQNNQQLNLAYEQEKALVSQLEMKMQSVLADVSSQNKIITAMASPDAQRIVLKGVEAKDPTSMALVVFNPTTREVYLNQGSLPQNPQGMQYQLWALKDGQPIDLGVFDIDAAAAFISMKGIDGAQAFAITLEEAGGKPTPNLEQLFVIGELG